MKRFFTVLCLLLALQFASPSQFALFDAGVADAQVTFSVLASGIDTTSNPDTSAAVNGPEYACIAYAVAGGGSIHLENDGIALTGGRGTWTELERYWAGRRAMAVFRGSGSVANEAVTITITATAGTWTETAHIFLDASGGDGTDDTPVFANGTGTSSTLGDVGTPDANDAVLQCVLHETDEAVTSTGNTAAGAVTGGTDIRTLHGWYDNSSPDETPNAAWASSSDWAAIGLIVNAGGGGSEPTLSAATPSGTLGTTTTATIGATSDDNTGTFYAVVDDAGGISGITAAQIKLGDDSGDANAIAACNAAVSTTSPSCGVTGLTAATSYSYAAVHTNGTGDSNVVTGTFTTAAAAAGTPQALHLQRLMNSN